MAYWNGEFALGGSATQIAVARNLDGRLEIFYVGTNGDLYHNQQTAANGVLWQGETPFPGDSAQQVSAIANQNGVLEIFYVGTNNDLYHNRQVAPNSTVWTGETHFSSASAKQVTVAANANGELEVFYVGTNNALYHNRQTAPNSEAWAGETRFSNDSAAQIAVAQNANGALEIFYVGTNGDLYHNRQTAPNSTVWTGETRFANDSAKQIAVARNADGTLEIFYVGTNNDLYHNRQTAANSTTWTGEAPFPNDSAQNVTAGQNADGRLEIFYVGTNSDLYHNVQTSPNSEVWGGETQIAGATAKQIAVAANADGRLELFYVGTNNEIYHNWQVLPPTSFGSNLNYLLVSDCRSMTDLKVSIKVTQDMVCEASSGPTKGFSFQLNAYSPANYKTAWQQYAIALWGSTVECFIDNWEAGLTETVNNFFPVATLPSAKIPAGSELTIALQNDVTGNITGATYTMVDNNGKTVANVSKTVSSDKAKLAPITAFELDIVGPVNSEGAILSSGAGTIIYTSSGSLTPTTMQPTCIQEPVVTAETANTSYGSVIGAGTNTLSQSFTVTNKEALFVNKEGKVRPRTLVPQR